MFACKRFLTILGCCLASFAAACSGVSVGTGTDEPPVAEKAPPTEASPPAPGTATGESSSTAAPPDKAAASASVFFDGKRAAIVKSVASLDQRNDQVGYQVTLTVKPEGASDTSELKVFASQKGSNCYGLEYKLAGGTTYYILPDEYGGCTSQLTITQLPGGKDKNIVGHFDGTLSTPYQRTIRASVSFDVPLSN